MFARKHVLFAAALIGLALFAIYISEALYPFIISFVLAYLFLPTVDYLESKHVSRSMSSSIIVLSITGIIIALLIIMIPFLINKTMLLLKSITLHEMDPMKMMHDAINNYLPFLSSHVTNIDNIINHSLQLIAESAQQSLITLTGKSMKLANIAVVALCSPIVSFYMLRDWHYVVSDVKSMIPRSYVSFFDNITKQLNLNLSYYLHGQLQVCVILAALYSVLLFVSKLQFAITLGILIGFLSFIPYIGFMIGGCIAIFLAVGQFNDLRSIMIVLIALMIGQLIDANFITPRIIGRRLNLHPNWIIFGLFVSVIIFGFFGAILALPLTAIATVIAKSLIQLYKDSEYYKENTN